MDFTDFTTLSAAVKLSLSVIGITQIAKRWVKESWHDRVLPIIAILSGVLGNMYILWSYTPEVVIAGFLTGLVTTGVVDFSKNNPPK